MMYFTSFDASRIQDEATRPILPILFRFSITCRKYPLELNFFTGFRDWPRLILKFKDRPLRKHKIASVKFQRQSSRHYENQVYVTELETSNHKVIFHLVIGIFLSSFKSIKDRC